MAADGSVIIDTKLDGKGLDKGLDTLKSKLDGLASGGIKMITGAIVGLGAATAAYGAVSIKAFTEAEEAVTKLATVVLNNSKNTQVDVDALNAQAKALEKVGVYSADVTTAMQAQLATFDLQGKNIEKITPALLDMMAAEKGMNATQEDAKAIGQMLGNVYKGNYASMQKMGFEITEAQKKMIEFGDETDQTNAVFEILGSTYDGLNAKMRETFGGQLQVAKNNLDNFMQSTGEILGSALLPEMQKLNPLLAEMSDKLAAAFSSPEIRAGIANLATNLGDFLVDAINGLVNALPSIIAGFNMFLDALSWIGANLDWLAPTILTVVGALTALSVTVQIVTAAQTLLNLVMSANPIGLIVLAIAALVGAFIFLWNTCEPFRNFWIGLWEGIKLAVSSFVEFFTRLPETIGVIIDNVIAFFGKLLEYIGFAIGWIIGHIANFYLQMWQFWTIDIPNAINWFVTFIMELPAKLWLIFLDVIAKVAQFLNYMKEKISTEIPRVVQSIVDFFKDLPDRMLNIGKNVVEGLWNGINSMVGWIKDKIVGFAQGIIDGFKESFDINSPSVIMEKLVGKNLALGIGEGFSGQLDNLKRMIARDSATLTGAAVAGASYSYNINQNFYTQTVSPYQLEKASRRAMQIRY